MKSSALMYALQKGRIGIVEDLMFGEIAPCYVKEAIVYAIQNPEAYNSIPPLAQKHIIETMIREKFPMIAMAAKYDCLNAIRIFMEAGAA